MENYNPITQEVLEKLNALVGEKYVWTDPDHLEQYKTDEETDPRLFRTLKRWWLRNYEQVAAIMKLANQYGFPVTPRSGGTSVSDGAIAVCGGLVLLLERLDKIEKVDADGMYLIAQAGFPR